MSISERVKTMDTPNAITERSCYGQCISKQLPSNTSSRLWATQSFWTPDSYKSSIQSGFSSILMSINSWKKYLAFGAVQLAYSGFIRAARHCWTWGWWEVRLNRCHENNTMSWKRLKSCWVVDNSLWDYYCEHPISLSIDVIYMHL